VTYSRSAEIRTDLIGEAGDPFGSVSNVSTTVFVEVSITDMVRPSPALVEVLMIETELVRCW
jgi:ketol-acid reductoisomerase